MELTSGCSKTRLLMQQGRKTPKKTQETFPT